MPIEALKIRVARLAGKRRCRPPEGAAAGGRIAWVDWLRSIGIILIVWGHYQTPPGVERVIYSFHVPLFFFISGYLNSRRNLDGPLSAYFLRRVRGLLVPYLVLGLLGVAIWVAKVTLHPGNAPTSIPLWRPLLGLLYGTGSKLSWMRPNVALWFIPALFSMHMIHYPVRRLLGNPFAQVAGALLLCGIGMASFRLLPVRAPWSVQAALLCYPFYAVGNVLALSGWRGTGLRLLPRLGALVLLAAVQAGAILLSGATVDVRIGQFGHPATFLIAAASGIALFLLAFEHAPPLGVVEAVSTSTISIFTLQEPFNLVLTAILVIGLGASNIQGTVWGGLLYTAACLLTLTVFGRLAGRFVPFAVGARGRRPALAVHAPGSSPREKPSAGE